MHDAVRIAFTTDQREGVGTTFQYDTRIGPLRTRDLMTTTEWVEGAAMEVWHEGWITGEGRFTLSRVGQSTRFQWRETLHFLWWLSGSFGSAVAAPVLGFVWRRNLDLLGRRLGGYVQ